MPAPQAFKGKFRFPGTFAFLQRADNPDALLQSDDPFTGVFSDLTARNTNNVLQAQHQSGDQADLSGLILIRQVNGRDTPVLFLFD